MVMVHAVNAKVQSAARRGVDAKNWGFNMANVACVGWIYANLVYIASMIRC